MLRICPERDAVCPHGMECPYARGYGCLPEGFNARARIEQHEDASTVNETRGKEGTSIEQTG